MQNSRARSLAVLRPIEAVLARQQNQASGGRGTRFRRLCTPRAPARVPQDRSWPGRPRGQHGSPFSCLGPAGLRRRPHAFHTGARRWNRGHGRDLAKAQRNRSRTASAHRDRKKIQNRDRESKSDAKSRSLNFSWFSCNMVRWSRGLEVKVVFSFVGTPTKNKTLMQSVSILEILSRPVLPKVLLGRVRLWH